MRNCNGTAWEIETVDSAGDVGEFASLALDSNDDPHISYYDFDNEDLKYALLSEPCLLDADCNDNNDCTDDTCNVPTGNCVFTPNSNSCDDGLFCTLTDQCSGGSCVGTGDDPCTPIQLCDEETDTCIDDSDGDGVFDNTDNCIDTPNPGQEDTYPPGGNSCGDACECESDFTPDGDVDGEDLTLFLTDFGRGSYTTPCDNGNTCNGDFLCDGDVDSDRCNKVPGRLWERAVRPSLSSLFRLHLFILVSHIQKLGHCEEQLHAGSQQQHTEIDSDS